ncbi:glycosyltransferase family 2 protein [Paraburkholderia sp. JPY303]|uniref:Putative LPLAT superfamily acyltransferase n=1 Tax=Paraburkholderia atlantica TaxID=2654982 RepID=A0A7W8VA02_PARAM|nr:glycosyltransferase family 2 protein [Paraburkholderia atlantica]MBB5428364.1 putative LPLAT superfamily acyltransferase [Paraburkholderia atlantica]NUY32963.1 glycosyltransferase family 2 protein [Paraburkholderia atlantica]
MKFAPCIVIPIYNHKDAIGATVANLAVHGLPIFVVDDGSDEPTQQILAALALQYAQQMTLLRLPENGGKGAAVMAGLRAARAAGYTHALQIDADGQHDASDVPRFLDAARAEPGAVILGRPVYDDSVPKARLYGRYLTHVWVWIETLSLTIRDSMCGFRLYPLALACELIDRVRLPTRMDFDIEILVRLYWRRAAFRSIPTRVTYAADGVSHFDVLWDNVRISRSHTRLVFGMLWRLPMLLAHKLMPRRGARADTADESADEPRPEAWWRIAERGSHLGMSLLALSCKLLGRRFTALWLHPVVAYFLLTGRAARVASDDYFTRLSAVAPSADTPRPGWLSAYRHMLAFAQSGFDKLAAWSGRVNDTDVTFDDPSAFEALIASGKGALVIGAHLGNLEMVRALAVRGDHAKVTAVVYTEHARRFNQVLASSNRDFARHLLEVGDFGPETAVLMQQRIDAGELLVIVGDRVPAREAGRTTDAQFLGASAPFAQGPYVLAHALGCPVYLFFCLKERDGYRMYFEPFAERIELPRRERAQHLAAWAQRYALRLEHYCRKAPYQWFNFFDFWASPKRGANGRT